MCNDGFSADIPKDLSLQCKLILLAARFCICNWKLMSPRINLGTFKQGVSKQGVMTFAWRPGSQYDVAATRGADSVLASDCRAQFGRPSTRRGWRICVAVRLPVRPHRETMHWQANTNTPLSVTPF